MATDTTAEARRAQESVWRSLGPERRVRLAASMSEDVRRVTLAGMARRRPDFSHERLVRELILRMHDVDVAAGARIARE